MANGKVKSVGDLKVVISQSQSSKRKSMDICTPSQKGKKADLKQTPAKDKVPRARVGKLLTYSDNEESESREVA